jgi:hypothetical protein
MIIQHLEENCRFVRRGQCNNKDCPEPLQTERLPNEHILARIEEMDDINVAFDHEFTCHHLEV